MSDEEAVVEVNNTSPLREITVPTFGGGPQQTQQTYTFKIPPSPPPPPAKRLSDDKINALSGAIAGVAAGIIVCPLDVAKTRLQAQGGLFSSPLHSSYKYRGMLGTLKTIVSEEGILGLYRGLTPIVVGYIPTWTIYFLIYEKAKAAISTYQNARPRQLRSNENLGKRSTPKSDISSNKTNGDSSQHDTTTIDIYRDSDIDGWDHDTQVTSEQTALQHIAAAVTAGAVSTLVSNPIWVVKTRLMSQRHYKNTLDAVRTMYRTEGIKVFYTGLGPAFLGLVHVAVQFPLYEKFKSLFPAPATPSQILAASFFSKIVASSLTYPHEVIRTRNQIHLSSRKYYGIVHTVETILREEGWRAFYAGLGTNLVRAVPSSAITLLTYELVSTKLKVMRDSKDTQDIQTSF